LATTAVELDHTISEVFLVKNLDFVFEGAYQLISEHSDVARLDFGWDKFICFYLANHAIADAKIFFV
jgi:hypothetical protein